MKINDLPYPTLPASWYVDPEILEIEQKTVLASGPDFVGCIGTLPQDGSYCTVAQQEDSTVLVRSGGEVRLLRNICLHRGMQLMKGRGTAKVLLCPMHLWSYHLDGKLLKAPYYDETPCLELQSTPLQSWNGLLFAGKRDVANDFLLLSGRPELDISSYLFPEVEQEEQSFNWKVPVEVLLENYHIPPLHPGFCRFIHPGAWAGSDGAYDSEHLYFQEIKPHPDFWTNPKSSTFERWQQAILKISGGKIPQFAALIGLYAPNFIFEWWPYTFTATTYWPKTPGRTLMTRMFGFDPKALEVVPEYPELVKAAWYETQQQDEEAHTRLHKGRRLAYERDPEALAGYETYQSPMEESVAVFHAHLMRTVLEFMHGNEKKQHAHSYAQR